MPVPTLDAPPVRRPEARTVPAQRRALAQRDELSRVRFRRALALVLMTLVVPGSAQLAAGNRRVGRIAVRVALASAAALVLVVLLGLKWHGVLFSLATDPRALWLLRVVLVVLAVGWALLFVDAWRLGRPLDLERRHRLRLVLANVVVMAMVVGSLLYVSHLVQVQRSFVVHTFGGSHVTAAHAGRYNVLLLGADSGDDRWGTRPDSITLASVDASSGKTVLFGLPRNLTDFKFPAGSVLAAQFPKGYTDELNSLVTYASDHQKLFPGSDNGDDAGVEAMREAVEGITGLKINYYGMVNLDGFQGLIDAMGGITLNIRDRIPIGRIGDITGYVQPGIRKVNGYEALWYARSRAAADDYSRMARQKCVMNAMLQQLSPTKLVANFQSITEAAQGVIKTDLPASELDRFAELALKARKEPVSTVSFVPPAINTGHPDLAKIQQMVKDAISSSSASGEPASAAGGSGGADAGTQGAASQQDPGQGFTEDKAATQGASKGSLSAGYTANETADLTDAC